MFDFNPFEVKPAAFWFKVDDSKKMDMTAIAEALLERHAQYDMYYLAHQKGLIGIVLDTAPYKSYTYDDGAWVGPDGVWSPE